ncbi:hypothetical protein EAG08_14120 [Chryseobacterium sp. 3008163]|nr:hypothetical protein EAG08_14120 [Chryseobacterium sp. 3008163]
MRLKYFSKHSFASSFWLAKRKFLSVKYFKHSALNKIYLIFLKNLNPLIPLMVQKNLANSHPKPNLIFFKSPLRSF